MIEYSQMREQLRSLPEADLPGSLWPRVESGRKKKMRRRKLGLGIAGLAMLTLLTGQMISPLHTRSGDQQIASNVAPQKVIRNDQEIQADVQAIDRALQAAYDRGASDSEIAPMWVARYALLAGARPNNPSARPDRI